MQLSYMTELARQQRVPRRPRHAFQLRTKPFQIQPFCIAPVLPGETMQNAFLQARAVTDPLRNRFLGWRADYMLYYVKLRDLDGRDDFTKMFTQLNYDISSYNAAANEWSNHFGGAPDWTALCLKRVVEEWFRNEGETWNSNHIDNVPIAQIKDIGWLDSIYPSATESGDDIDLTDVASPGGSAVLASEIEDAMRTWTWLQSQNLTNMSYEDFLAQAGIKGMVQEEPHRPELMRHWSEWTYPVNTVEPTTGVPTSACSWVIADRADKSRYFKEHGFILGVTVKRPKVYFKLSGSAVGLMTDMFAWLPSVMSPDPGTSLVTVAQGEGPIQNGSDVNGYVVDRRDLFIHGDQFINFANTAVDAGLVDLPTATLIRRYASAADAASLFADDDPGDLIQIHEDGVINFNILGQQEDITPGTTAGNVMGSNPSS